MYRKHLISNILGWIPAKPARVDWQNWQSFVPQECGYWDAPISAPHFLARFLGITSDSGGGAPSCWWRWCIPGLRFPTIAAPHIWSERPESALLPHHARTHISNAVGTVHDQATGWIDTCRLFSFKKKMCVVSF